MSNNLFVDKNKDITVEVFYADLGDKGMFAESSKEELLKNSDVSEEDISRLEVTFRYPNYKDSMDLLSKVVKTDGVDMNVDAGLLRYQRFVSLAKSWSIDVPCNEENISMLNSVVANEVMAELEKHI